MTDATKPTTIRHRLTAIGARVRLVDDLIRWGGVHLGDPDPDLDQWAAWIRDWIQPGHPMRPHAGWLIGRLVKPEAVGIVAGADLRVYDLSRAILRGCNLRGCNLRGARLHNADLTGAILRDADLRDADLSVSELRGADIRDADLRHADLTGARLDGADLALADLTGANMNGVWLDGAHLRAADLSGASLRLARLGGAHLTAARLDGAYRSPTDAPVPGWDLVDEQLVAAA